MRAPDVSISAVVKPSNIARLTLLRDAQQARQVTKIVELVDAPREIEHALRRIAVEPAPARASAKLVGELVVAHRIRGAALAEVGRAADLRSVVELDFYDRRHLVEAGGLRLRMHPEVDLLNHRLNIGPIDDRVGEFLEPRLALEQQDRHAELHAEFRLQ